MIALYPGIIPEYIRIVRYLSDNLDLSKYYRYFLTILIVRAFNSIFLEKSVLKYGTDFTWFLKYKFQPSD